MTTRKRLCLHAKNFVAGFFLNYSNKVLIPMISCAYYISNIDIILLSDLFLFFLCLCLVVCSDGHGSSTYSFKESSSQVSV